MALTPDQLSIVRAEIGDAVPPEDGDLDDLHEQYGGLVGIVRHIWKHRLADLLADPASFTVPGEYGQNTTENIKAIQKRLFELASYADDGDLLPPGGVAVVTRFFQLVRQGQDR